MSEAKEIRRQGRPPQGTVFFKLDKGPSSLYEQAKKATNVNAKNIL